MYDKSSILLILFGTIFIIIINVSIVFVKMTQTWLLYLYADLKLDHVHAHIQHMFLCPMKPFEDMIEHLCKNSFRGLCLVN